MHAREQGLPLPAAALFDDARLLAQHAVAAGVDARLDVFPDLLHTFQMVAGRAAEADDVEWGGDQRMRCTGPAFAAISSSRAIR